ELDNLFPGMKFISYGDPGGAQRAQTDERTAIDILNQLGIKTEEAKTNLFTPRRDAVGNQLSRLVDGEPAFIIDPSNKMLIKGMNGSYKFKRIAVAGDERFKDEPDKNMYSHVCEALQYPMLHINTESNPQKVVVRRAPAVRSRRKGGKYGW
ncbi:MAG: hypothetical protein OEX07_09280, partial [Gammaproteobacteria bacterium]|nr:hypothetical protein [Gammaproteobacteria bacterium]